MTKSDLMPGTFARTTGQVLSGLIAPAAKHLVAMGAEWRDRRAMVHELGKLPGTHLRDIGLTKADLLAACSDRLDHPASPALAAAAQRHSGHW